MEDSSLIFEVFKSNLNMVSETKRQMAQWLAWVPLNKEIAGSIPSASIEVLRSIVAP